MLLKVLLIILHPESGWWSNCPCKSSSKNLTCRNNCCFTQPVTKSFNCFVDMLKVMSQDARLTIGLNTCPASELLSKCTLEGNGGQNVWLVVCSAGIDDTQPFDTDGCNRRKHCKTVVLFCAVARGWCGALPVKAVINKLVGSISMTGPPRISCWFTDLQFAFWHCAFHVVFVRWRVYNCGLVTAHVPCVQRSMQELQATLDSLRRNQSVVLSSSCLGSHFSVYY